ncbi:MAG: HAD-IIIA family hydrolase [Proteobacteria bacterium]|nr:HAD-IIIA family hydrolase [Pseudomonadota bacterium]
MKIVILCGGKGTRLGLGDLPKPMVPVDGIPLLERLVGQAAVQGFDDFIFLAGHGAGHICDHFGSGARWNVTIEHVVEAEPLGSAGCFRQIRDALNAPFIVLYGDILHDVDLAAFAEFGREKGGAGTLFVHPNDHPEDSDLVEIDQTDRIVAFHAKPHPPGARYSNLVSAAIYYLNPAVLDFIPPVGACDWGHDVFPRLCREASVHGYRSAEYAKDVGTPARLERAASHLREGRVARLSHLNAKPVVFVDRDGVVNEERGGILTPQDVALIPGSAQAIRMLNQAGIPVICVTNQPFIAKGQLTWRGLGAIGGEIDHQLAEAAGAYLDDLRICPHHPESGWMDEIPELKIVCACRKPAPGMLLDAAQFHNIDLSRSWMIGDRYCDIEAGRRAGTRTILVETGFAGSDHDTFAIAADAIMPDLATAITAIMEGRL